MIQLISATAEVLAGHPEDGMRVDPLGRTDGVRCLARPSGESPPREQLSGQQKDASTLLMQGECIVGQAPFLLEGTTV